MQTAIAEYTDLNETIRQAVFCVDFPFGVVAPTRRRMDEITRQTGVGRCSKCDAITNLRNHVCHTAEVNS